ncbi:MAG: hypothetical protein LBR53_06100 [Deltaproteobacteria bacterium]|jgi:hypothetical protein|nr:hypothetical protein [Deltaproteobacteria bacterium]
MASAPSFSSGFAAGTLKKPLLQGMGLLSAFLSVLAALLLLFLAFSGAFGAESESAPYESVRNPDGRELFRLSFLPKGASSPFSRSGKIPRDLSPREMGAAVQALGYWAYVINPSECPETPRASCAPRVVAAASGEPFFQGRPKILSGMAADYNLTLSQSLLNLGAPKSFNYANPSDYAVLVGVGDLPGGGGEESFDRLGEIRLFTLFAAEMARGLGLYEVGSSAAKRGGRDTQFASLLRPASGAEGGRLFSGESASLVYGDGIPRAVPVADAREGFAGARFALKNSPLSDSAFCNHPTPLAVELAALADLGYQVDLRALYGRSVYQDGATLQNGDSFMSAAPRGTGLHVYGSFNTVVQEGDLFASGPGGVGIRLDGRSNNLTVGPNAEVGASGSGGTGVLAAYGSDHVVTLLGAVSGAEDALRADIGPNLFPEEGERDLDGYGPKARRSFFRAGDGASPEEREAEAALSAPLVRSLAVAGLLRSPRRAVYASPGSYLESVNLVRGASIYGDLISDYDDLGRGTERTTTIRAGGTLNDPEKADPDFRIVLSGRILGGGRRPEGQGPRLYIGRGRIDLILVGGRTSVPDTFRADVESLEVRPGATLEIKPDLANLRPVLVRAENVIFSAGSVLRVSESTSRKKGPPNYFTPLLKIEVRGDPGFVNSALLETDPESSLSGGELAWFVSGPGDYLLAYVRPEAGLTLAD